MMETKERAEQNLRFDIENVICTTFYEFAKKEPTQFSNADWENDEFTFYRFKRASMIATENLLDKYKIQAVK